MTDNPIFVGPRHRIRCWRNLGMSMGFGVGIEFLFRDDFLTAEAAPLTSPRTTEPGPGILNITQTGANFSISSEALQIADNTLDWGQMGYLSNESFARVAGLVAYFTTNLTTQNNIAFGWYDRATFRVGGANVVQDFEHGANFAAGTSLGALGDGLNITALLATVVTPHELAVVLRSTGAFFCAKTTNFDWTLYWVNDTALVDPLYLALNTKDGIGESGTARISQLPSPWDTDFGIATDRLAGARGFGDQFVHEADFIGEFTQTTVPTAGFTSFQFRRQDVNNYWSVVVEPSTDLSLFETVAGVPTLRGIAVGVVGNGDRIVVIADGTTIRVYEQNTLRITYALAANFQIETDGSLLALGVGGAVSDIVAWPRVISGSALRALDRVADA